jgi:radical SAM superfamily enzyme YgiQ (UPF0313 family)
MKILLINPPFHRLKEFENVILPLGIASLAGYIQKPGREVKLYNADNPAVGEVKPSSIKDLLKSGDVFKKNMESDTFLVWEEIRQVIRDYDPDVVGVSVLSCKYGPAVKVTQIAKEISSEIITVWGGPHCSADGPNAVKDNECIDYAISHEGEIAFELFLQSLEEGKKPRDIPNLIYGSGEEIKVNPFGKYIDNLDELPFPLRDIDVFQERYSGDSLSNVMASRGCPFQCTFCDSGKVWGRKVRVRSAENIIQELRELNSRFGITKFNFVDDTFTFNSRNIIEFCSGLEESDLNIGWTCNTRMDALSDEVCKALRASGIICVSCGIESGSQRILDYIKKGLSKEQIRKGAHLLDKYKIDWHAFFMIGFPQETAEDIELTREFWKELKSSCITLSIFTPSPGNPLFDEIRQLGLLPENPEWSSFSWQNLNNYFVANFSQEDFGKIVKDMFREVAKYNNSLPNICRKVYRQRRYYYRHLPELISKGFRKFSRKN